jgi:hypothetical protein
MHFAGGLSPSIDSLDHIMSFDRMQVQAPEALCVCIISLLIAEGVIIVGMGDAVLFCCLAAV